MQSAAPVAKRSCDAAVKCVMVYKFFSMYDLRCNKLSEDSREKLDIVITLKRGGRVLKQCHGTDLCTVGS